MAHSGPAPASHMLPVLLNLFLKNKVLLLAPFYKLQNSGTEVCVFQGTRQVSAKNTALHTHQLQRIKMKTTKHT